MKIPLYWRDFLKTHWLTSCAISCCLIFFLFLSLRHAHRNHHSSHLETLRREIQIIERNIKNKGSYVQDLRKVQGLAEQYASKLIRPLDKETNYKYFLSIANKHEIVFDEPYLQGFFTNTGKPIEEREVANQICLVQYRLSAQGTFAAIVAFLKELLSESYFVIPCEIELFEAEESTKGEEPILKLQFLFYYIGQNK